MTGGQDIAYRPRGRISGVRFGAHPNPGAGALGAFRDHVPSMAYPDARRIDVRATLRDPFGNTFVRRFQQRASIDLYALVDLTGSLAYQGRGSKMELITALCVALARSATRTGDRFGLIGCDAGVRSDCFIPATKRRGVAEEAAALLGRARCKGASAAGLRQAGERLAGARKMAFLISDFLLPLGLLREIFESLAQHDVIPVIVGDASEDADLPPLGLMELADLETGARRLVFMRPELKRRWLEAERERRAEITRLARRYGRTPVRIADAFDIDSFSRDLMQA